MTSITLQKRQVWISMAAVAATLYAGPANAKGNLWVPGPRTLEIRNEGSRPASSLSWDDVSRKSSSPREICKAVKDRVKYSRDMLAEDEWRGGGKDTWDKGEGDCEDFATAVRDLCEEKGFKAEIYVVQSRTARAAHAVTVGEVNGMLWVSSNGSYEEAQSLNDAKDKLCRDLGWWTPEVEVYQVDKALANNGVEILPLSSGNDVVRTMPFFPAGGGIAPHGGSRGDNFRIFLADGEK